MAFTKIAAAGIDTSGSVVIQNLNTTGVVTAGSIVATTGTFSGNVSIAGTLTYEDVTNIDSIGLVTARSGVRIDAGGLVVTAGVSTFTSGPLLIGSDSSTGTASQPLQVTGGAYVSGNLGVGTTNPTNKLNIRDGSIEISGNSSQLYVNGTRSGDPDRLVFLNQTTSNTAASILLTGKTSGGVDAHTLLSSAPDNKFHIYVPGQYQATGTRALTIDSSGRLGIGTTNPNVSLDIFKTSYPEINLKTGTVTSTFGIDTGNNTFVVGSTTNHPFTLRTNGSDRLYLTSGGNIGIGITDPNTKLDIVCGVGSTGIVVRPSSLTADANGNANAVNNMIHLRMPYGANAGAVANAGAKIGIVMEGRNDGTFQTFGGGKRASIYGVSEDDGAGYSRRMGLAFYTSPTDAAEVERIRISNGGLVGIGTNAPTLNSKVEIYGTDANLQVHYANNSRGGIAALLNQRLAIYTTAAADHIVFGRSTTDATAISGTNFTEHVRINNTTGNTGIGTNNPSNKLHLYGTSDATELLQFEIGGQPVSSEKGRMIWRGTQSNGQSAKLAILSAGSGGNWGGDLRFYTKPANGSPDDNTTLRMSILSSGEFRLGSSDMTSISTDPAHTIGDVSQSSVQTNLARLIMQERVSNWISFKNGGGTHFGTIAVSGAGVNYGSNSDYRLKENVIPLSGSIQKIKALKPVTFNFIDRPEDIVDGFLAHEVQEVTPYAVTGEKDGYDVSGDVLDSDGKVVKQFVPEPEELEEGQTWVETSRDVKIQQLDPAKLVPVLTAALQDALAKIETLEARLDAAGL